jgi:hypothetical protein
MSSAPARPRQARNKAPLEKNGGPPRIEITVDNETYVVRQDEVTALDASQLRRATGYSFSGLMQAAQTDADIDVIAAFVWLARRQRGEKITFEKVAASITFNSEVELEENDAADTGADDPEG